MQLRIVLACLVVGIVTEAAAALLDLWRYHPAWLRVANALLVFGVVLGWMSSAFADAPAALRFAVGAGFGIAYEALNLAVLHAWSFPRDRLLVLRGPAALVLGVGLSWGIVPLVVPLLVGPR